MATTEFFLLLDPVPASRPRVSKWGTYYAKTYKDWMKRAAEILPPLAFPHAGFLRVELEFIVRKPRTSKLHTPRGDIDNYAKAILDALTKADHWGDDGQVVTLFASKRFAAPDEEAGIRIRIEPNE